MLSTPCRMCGGEGEASGDEIIMEVKVCTSREHHNEC